MAETATIVQFFSRISVEEPSDSVRISDLSLIFAYFRMGKTSKVSFFFFASRCVFPIWGNVGTFSGSKIQINP